MSERSAARQHVFDAAYNVERAANSLAEADDQLEACNWDVADVAWRREIAGLAEITKTLARRLDEAATGPVHLDEPSL